LSKSLIDTEILPPCSKTPASGAYRKLYESSQL